MKVILSNSRIHHTLGLTLTVFKLLPVSSSAQDLNVTPEVKGNQRLVLQEAAPLPYLIQDVPDLPFDGILREDQTEGLAYAMRLTQGYNDNLSLDEEASLATQYTSLSPSLSWRSAPKGGASLVAAASYSPQYTVYYDDVAENTLNHAFSSTLTYEGAKTLISLQGNYRNGTDTNRVLGEFVETTFGSAQFEIIHKPSDKLDIELEGNYNKRITEANNDENTNYGLGGSILWQASPKLVLGPTMRYSSNQNSTFDPTTSYNTSLRAKYYSSGKLSFDTSLGADFVDAGDGETRVSPAGQLSVLYNPSPVLYFRLEGSYQAIPVQQFRGVAPAFFDEQGEEFFQTGVSELGGQQLTFAATVNYTFETDWNFQLSVSRQTSPSFSLDGGELTTLNLGARVVRTFGLAQVGASTTHRITDFESASSGSDSEFTSQRYTLDYSTPTMIHNLNFNAGVSYISSQGDREFDQTIIALSLSYRF